MGEDAQRASIRELVYTKRACKRRVFHANENRTDHYGRSRSAEEIFRCGRSCVALRYVCSSERTRIRRETRCPLWKRRGKIERSVIEWNELDAEGEEFKGERERGRDDVSRGREIGLYGW